MYAHMDTLILFIYYTCCFCKLWKKLNLNLENSFKLYLTKVLIRTGKTHKHDCNSISLFCQEFSPNFKTSFEWKPPNNTCTITLFFFAMLTSFIARVTKASKFKLHLPLNHLTIYL